MTLEQDEVDVGAFGLEGTFPHPGWVVLDAARHHGFTGELTFGTIPTVKVYLDGGMIYLAERVTDPSLGSRLVDAGALNAAQLEHGSMLLGDVAHLGRLFERVPSVNRQTVMVMTEMMTEECVGWLAGQLVQAVEVAPYRHHPAGVQRWLHPSASDHLEPGDPLPPPPADATPVELVAPEEPLFSPTGSYDDGLITWDQPSWLDEQLVAPSPIDLSDESSSAADAEHRPSAPPADEPPALPVRIPNASAADQAVAGDWTEVGAGVTDAPDAPAASLTEEPSLSVESALDGLMVPPPGAVPPPHEEPSLSVESALDELMTSPPDVSADTTTHEITEPDPRTPRPTGPPTAQPHPPAPSMMDDWVDRLESDGLPEPGSEPLLSTKHPPPSQPVAADRFEVIWPSGEVDDQFGSTDTATITEGDPDLDRAGPTARAAPSSEPPAGDPVAAPATLEPPDSAPDTFVPVADELTLADDEVTDEVVLAVRRAVASIETSSLDARRRLAATERDDDPSRGVDRPSERPIRSLRPVSETSDALTPGATSARRVPTRSVFDDDVVVVPAESSSSAPAEVAEPVLPVLPPPAPTPVVEQHEQRVGALRRLIGSLRRR